MACSQPVEPASGPGTLVYTPAVLALPQDLRRALSDGGPGLALMVLRLGALGDVLRTLPAVRLLRGALPGTRISWVVGAGLAGILERHPDVDEVVPFPRSRWRALGRAPWRWPGFAPELRAWRRRLRAVAPQLVLDFHGDLRSGLTGWLSGAKVRLGYAGHQQKECNFLFTTHRVPAGERRRSRIERNLELVRALGLPAQPLPDGGLTEPAPAKERARSIGGSAGAYAVIAAGVSRRQAYKKPPPELLAAAAQLLAGSGVRSWVVYGPGEEPDARAVVAAAGGAASLAPPTDLDVLAALLREARLFVGGDTGPMHLACAVGCPVVALYGPTDPEVNAPWGVPHATVSPPGRSYTGIKRLDRRQGFEGLDAETVRAAVAGLLEQPRARESIVGSGS